MNAAKKEQLVRCKGNMIRLSFDFLSEMMAAESSDMIYLNYWKTNSARQESFILVNCPQNEEKFKMFTGKQKLKKFFKNRPTLQGMLKEFLQSEWKRQERELGVENR